MTLASYWRVLRDNRNFRLIWLAQIVSELGDWFYSVAIFSFLLELTGSAQMVAFAFMAQVLPQCFFAPTAGVINDRIRRQQVMIFADWVRAGIVLAMALVRSRGTLWLLFALLFLETACWALFEPGHRSVIPNITKGDETPVANALCAATWSVNFAIGAALGGFVAVAFGRNTVFVLNSLSFVASALLIRRMRFTEPHAEHVPPLAARDLVDFTPILEGARYILRRPKLLATIFVKGGAGLMGTSWVILPVLGERVFPVRLHGMSAAEAGTLGMSTLLASRGLGAIFGAYLGGNIAGTSIRRIRWIILAGFLMGAAGYLMLGVAGSLTADVLTLVVAHAGGSAGWTASTTLLQQQTEDRFRGRVFSAEFAFTMLILALASFVAGRFLDAGAAVRSVALATGAAMLVPAAAWILASRGWDSSSDSRGTL
jgi:predicted MFS family arabinose efflux permease